MVVICESVFVVTISVRKVEKGYSRHRKERPHPPDTDFVWARGRFDAEKVDCGFYEERGLNKCPRILKKFPEDALLFGFLFFRLFSGSFEAPVIIFQKMVQGFILSAS